MNNYEGSRKGIVLQCHAKIVQSRLLFVPTDLWILIKLSAGLRNRYLNRTARRTSQPKMLRTLRVMRWQLLIVPPDQRRLPLSNSFPVPRLAIHLIRSSYRRAVRFQLSRLLWKRILLAVRVQSATGKRSVPADTQGQVDTRLRRALMQIPDNDCSSFHSMLPDLRGNNRARLHRASRWRLARCPQCVPLPWSKHIEPELYLRCPRGEINYRPCVDLSAIADHGRVS